MRRLTVLAAAVLAFGGGCSDADEPSSVGATTTTAGDATITTSTSSATSASPAPTEPTAALGDSDDTGKSELEDGRHYGFWKSFEIGDTIAFGEFDLAYFLTGNEAEAAAKAHGDEPPNDYYVVNDNPKLRTLIAKGNTEVLVLSGGGADTKKSNVADFAVERNKQSGFWVTITDGIVTKIEEQYVA